MDTPVKKILIIEDEKSLSMALELKLLHDGFEVRTLSNGEGVIDLIQMEKFSLIICDLIMPKVDGFQVLKEIKEKGINTPVIILTNLGQPEDKERVKEIGFEDFLIKSDTPLAKIVERIKGLLK